MIFQTIEPQNNPGRWARPQATINIKGQIKISRVAFELLGEPTHVTVLFDRTSQTIALRGADKHDTGTHEPIAHGIHGKHGGRLIKVPGLIEHIEADLFTCMRFTNVRIDNNNRLILELANARPAYHGKRVGVYNEWRLKHDEAYAENQSQAYHRGKAKKLANETDEERAIREDRAIREKEYRDGIKAEKARRRESVKAKQQEQKSAERDAKAQAKMVEVDLGNGNTMRITKARFQQLERARRDYATRAGIDYEPLPDLKKKGGKCFHSF